MTDIDYAALRALAENATPGPWFAEGLDDEPTIAHDFDTEGHGPGHGSFIFPDKAADAEFIAAMDPPTVIALLDELEAARRAREDMAASLDARWEHSDHLSAKYWLRMRAAENAQKATEAENERLRAEVETGWEYAVQWVGTEGLPVTDIGADREDIAALVESQDGWAREVRRPAGPWVPVPEQNPEPKAQKISITHRRAEPHRYGNAVEATRESKGSVS